MLDFGGLLLRGRESVQLLFHLVESRHQLCVLHGHVADIAVIRQQRLNRDAVAMDNGLQHSELLLGRANAQRPL